MSNNLHPLDRLIAYWRGYSGDDIDDQKKYYVKVLKKEEGNYSVKVRLKNRAFMFENFFSEKDAKDHIYRYIVNTAIDMMLDDDLWNQYRDKLKKKFSSSDLNDNENPEIL